MDYIAKKAWKERSLNNHCKAVTHFSFFAISESSVMANQGISLHCTIINHVLHRVYTCYNERVSLQNSVLSIEWVLTDTRKHTRTGVCLEAAAAYFHLVVNDYFVIKVTFAASRYLLPWVLNFVIHIYIFLKSSWSPMFLSLATQGLKTPALVYRLPTISHSPIIKILTLQSAIKINEIKSFYFSHWLSKTTCLTWNTFLILLIFSVNYVREI